MRRLSGLGHALALATMMLVPGRLRAQVGFTQVPAASSTTTQSTIVVTVTGQYGQDASCYGVHDCFYYPWDQGYQQYTETATLNGGSVTSAFTVDEQSNCWTSDGYWDNYECDQSGTMTGTLTYPVAHNTIAVSVLADDGSTWSNSYAFWVNAPPPGMAVAVNALVNPSLPANAGTQSTWFLVRNTGGSPGTVFLSAACTAALSTGPCTPSLQEAYLGLNDTLKVRIDFPAMVAGTSGTATLVATDPQTGAWMNSGTSGITVVAPPRLVVSSPTLAAGADFERGLCPDFALLGGGALQCGSLRMTHALPATTAYGKTYAPTLAYFGDYLSTPWVLVDVTLPAGQPAPGTLLINYWQLAADGVTRTGAVRQESYAGSQLRPGGTVRLSVGNLAFLTANHQIVNIEVEAVADGQHVTSLTGKLATNFQDATTGLARAWTLLGLERLWLGQPGGSLLWTDGDGSTREYRPRGNGVFVARTLDRADTLVTTSTGYVRLLPNRARVEFDATGRHARTVDRFGRATSFGYADATTLASITIPSGQQYTIAPSGANLVVTAPGNRTVTLARDSYNRLVTITDPDQSTESFEYADWDPYTALQLKTDQRGTRVYFGWDGCNHTVRSSEASADASQYVAIGFDNRVGRGYCAGPQDATYAAYVGQGPRHDVTAVTWLWVDSLGAVTQSQNALGQVTTIEHGDARFPTLATRVLHANGFVQTTAYDARGHVASTTSWNPLGDGRNSTTRYTWDPSWDAVTAIVGPTGEVTSIGLDATGMRAWQQVGTDASHRVTFNFASGLLQSMTEPSTVTPDSATTVFDHDGFGNLSGVTSPIGFRSFIYRDALGRDTLTITPIDSAEGRDAWSVATYGQRARTRYDAAGRVAEQVTWVPGRAGTADPVADSIHVAYDYDAGGLRLATRRWVARDRNGIGVITDRWAYDRLGRDTLQTGAVTHRFRYDPAGNVVWTDRGDSSVYDVLNRRIRHLLPPKAFALNAPGQSYENPAGIPADVEQFAYDVMGNLTQADNADATVHRGYYPGGALAGDTLAVRQYQSTYYTQVPMTYTYDLSGRPTSFHHSMISGGDDVVRYDYNAQSGALAHVTDPQGNLFTYGYDVADRLASIAYPGGHTEQYLYDLDSRLQSRGGASIRRDATGKVLSADGYGFVYAPLGQLRTMEWSINDPANYIRESHYPDAFGSDSAVVRDDRDTRAADELTHRTQRFYDTNTGSFGGSRVFITEPKWYGWQEELEQSLDNGHVIWERSHSYTKRLIGPYCDSGTLGDQCYMPVDDATDRQSAYDANDHLRLLLARTTRHYWSGDTVTVTTSETHYDALGRRVLARYRPHAACYNGSSECRGTVDYQYWAGDQLLAESRQVDASVTGGLGPGYAGDVVYTHAGGIDQPVSLFRRSATCQFTTFPMTDFRGALVGGTFNGSTPSCAWVDWPGTETSIFRRLPHMASGAPWNGSLATLGGDQTGLQYMRNRYYNPASGQFTQADPIGAAGGLNVFGYVGGDPVNYADPFGLCAKDKDGVEDANCRKLINGLNATADEADKTLPAGQTNRFREAAAGYEATDREVEFVDALDSRLNQRNYNGDGNPATFAMGRTMDDRILIGRFLGPGDVMAVATHEILVHGHEKRLYFGDYKDATVDLNRQIWSQLPARYRPSAELWRRKIQ